MVVDGLEYTYNSRKKQIVLITLGALLLVLSDLFRRIKIPLILSLLITAFLIDTGPNSSVNQKVKRNLFFLIILSLCLFVFLNSLKSKYGHSERISVVNSLETMIYSYNDMYTKGDFWAGLENGYNFTPITGSSYRQKRIFTKYISQISQYPFAYLEFIFNKTTHFFQNSFYYFFMDKSVVDQPIGVKLMLALSLSNLHKMMLYVFAFFGLISMIFSGTLTKYNKFYINYSLFFLPIIVQSEVNPTYSILVLPFVVLFAV